jgi:pyruvate/2-oxoglutarate dehydrogenase complex dihydrolipoamide acyltransferase (E2) component
MFRLFIPCLLLIASAAAAGEPVITETATGITVEYTGTAPGQVSSPERGPAQAKPAEQPAVDKDPAKLVRSKFLAAQIRQLQKEQGQILATDGGESDQERAQKSALAAEIKLKEERFASEYLQLTGDTQPLLLTSDQPLPAADNQSAFQKQKNDREERKRRTKEMHKDLSSASGAP